MRILFRNTLLFFLLTLPLLLLLQVQQQQQMAHAVPATTAPLKKYGGPTPSASHFDKSRYMLPKWQSGGYGPGGWREGKTPKPEKNKKKG
jgi:hypothetical protein